MTPAQRLRRFRRILLLNQIMLLLAGIATVVAVIFLLEWGIELLMQHFLTK